jgi:hypothetical protein
MVIIRAALVGSHTRIPQADLVGRILWAHPPWFDIGQFLATFTAAWAADPRSTSATTVLPVLPATAWSRFYFVRPRRLFCTLRVDPVGLPGGLCFDFLGQPSAGTFRMFSRSQVLFRSLWYVWGLRLRFSLSWGLTVCNISHCPTIYRPTAISRSSP